MKKGDKVTIRDQSYSQSIVNGKLIHNVKAGDNKQYVVIETGCRFPASDFQAHWPGTFNNTIIQGINSGKVIFIEERFLDPVSLKHKIMIDVVSNGCFKVGQYVDISDKLYQEIKNEQE